MEDKWKFLGEGTRGVLKAKILEAKYEAKLEFLGGRGGAKQKPSMGGVWIFCGTTQSLELQHFLLLLNCIKKLILRAELKL